MTARDNIAMAARRGWQTHHFIHPQGWAECLVAAGLLTPGAGPVTPALISFEAGQERLELVRFGRRFEGQGIRRQRQRLKICFYIRGSDTLLSRSAWIDGMGLLTKTATVFPGNRTAGQPMIGGGVMLFDDAHRRACGGD